MYDFLRFGSIEEGLAFIAVQLALLTAIVFFEYRRKELEEKQRELEDLIFDIEMYARNKCKRLKKG